MLANAFLFSHIIVKWKREIDYKACLGNQHQGLLLASHYSVCVIWLVKLVTFLDLTYFRKIHHRFLENS